KTLTPLWTGDIDRKCSKIKETSILGSLRWWYEALIRGLGGKVCNITSENPKNRCDYDRDKGNICDVCKIFGCTGWSRRFRLEVEGKRIPLFFVTNLNSNLRWLCKIFNGREISKNPTYSGRREYICDFNGINEIFDDEMVLKYLSLEQPKIHNPLIEFLIKFVSKYSALGAKTQNGFGQIHVKNIDSRVLKEGKKLIEEQISKKMKTNDSKFLWDFRNYFILEFKIPEDDNMIRSYLNNSKIIGVPLEIYNKYKNRFIPCAFDIRYKSGKFGLREHFKSLDKDLSKNLFGYVESEDSKSGSQIFVSHLYRGNTDNDPYNLKIWGFVNENLLEKNKKVTSLGDLMNEIENHIYNSVFKNSKTDLKKKGIDIIEEELK
ncbi:MAG: type III-B CRISPR module RAMP protein Cmr1, partial [Methanosarcinales archaeon]